MLFSKKENLYLKENNLYLQPSKSIFMRARSIRNFFILIIASCATATSSYAQDASRIFIEPDGWSIGTNIGLTDLWGDVGTKVFLDHYTNSKYFDKVAAMGGMFGRYTIHPCLGLKFGVNYGVLYATDEWNYDKAQYAPTQGSDYYQRYARQQKARASVFEGNFMVEFTPLRFNPEKERANKRGQVVFGLGIGYFHFTPQNTVALGNKFINTYDLHIEGDGFGPGFPPSYSLWQFCIPMSIAYRWDIGKHLNLGFEFMYRKTFTDYLDGVSGKYIDPAEYKKHLSASEAATAALIQDKEYYHNLGQPNVAGNIRGNSSNNDAYSSFSVTLYYKLLAREGKWWTRF